MIPNDYTRVTEPLKMLKNFDDIDPQVLINAADRGTRVHKYCEMHMKNLFCPEIDEDCVLYVESFIAWYDEMVESPLLIEERINSADFKLSGQVDLVAILKNDTEISVIDIKTPVKPCSTWALQSAAYKILLEKQLELKISRRICLMLSKYGSAAKLVEYTDHQNDERLYLNALELYRKFYI